MIDVYVISVTTRTSNGMYGGQCLSQTGYPNLLQAQSFIENRGDKPVKINPYCYQSDKILYTINIIEVNQYKLFESVEI